MGMSMRRHGAEGAWVWVRVQWETIDAGRATVRLGLVVHWCTGGGPEGLLGGVLEGMMPGCGTCLELQARWRSTKRPLQTTAGQSRYLDGYLGRIIEQSNYLGT